MNRPNVTEFICSIKKASQPAVSPSGDRIVYVVSDVDPDTLETRSWLTMANFDYSDTRRITAPGTAPSSPTWTHDGESIVYVAALPREVGFGIFQLSLQGGEAQELGRIELAPSDLAIAPNSRTIAFIAAHDPNKLESKSALAPVRVITRVDYKEDGLGIPNEEHFQIFLLDLETAGISKVTEGRFDHAALTWSPDGKTLGSILRTRIGLKSQISLIDVETGRQKLIGPPDHAVRGWSWSPDGSSILAFRSSHPEYDGEFYLLNLESRAERRLTNGFRWCIDYGTRPIAWIDSSHAIIGGYESAGSGLWRLNIDTGSLKCVSLLDAYHFGVCSSPGSKAIIQNRNGPDSSGELVAINCETGSLTNLTDLNGKYFSDHPPGVLEQLNVVNESLKVGYLLKKPHDFDPGKTYPVVFEIHGGPHMFRGFAIETSNQLLLDEGYLVVCPNPRGSLSWGLEYTKGVLGDWGGGDWRDILAVVDHLAAMPFVDETRLGIYGYSYGGYMTSWAIGQTDRFKAAVIGAPLTDLISRDGTSDIGYAASWLEYNGELPDIHEMLVRQSPVTHMHKAVTPTLIMHPEDDQRCPIGQGEQLFVGLMRAGVETEFVRYPGQSHHMPWNGPAEYRIDFYTRLLDWFEKYL